MSAPEGAGPGTGFRSRLRRVPGGIHTIVGLGFLVVASALAFRDWTRFHVDGLRQYQWGEQMLHGGGLHAWAADYWPPLYGLLTAVMAEVMPAPMAGRLISVVAGTVVILVVPWTGRALGLSPKWAVVVQLALACNPIFLLLATLTENNMLDLAFWSLTIHWAVTRMHPSATPSRRDAALLGVWLGGAALTRYTSYVLPLVVLAGLAWIAKTEPARRAPGYITAATAFLVALPWWVANTIRAGSPLASAQYLNVGAGLRLNPFTASFRGANLKEFRRWLWRDHAEFTSTADIILNDPVQFLWHWVLGFGAVAWFSAQVLLGVVVVAVLVAWPAWQRLPAWPRGLLLGAVALYWALLASAFVVVDSLAPVMYIASLVAVVGVAVVVERFDSARRRQLVAGAAIGLLLLPGLVAGAFTGVLASDRIQAATPDGFEAGTAFLRAHDPDIANKTLMAGSDLWSYELGAGFLGWPHFYDGNLSGMYRYEHLHDRVVRYAPSHPAAHLVDLRADYILFTEQALRSPPFRFVPLADIDLGEGHATVYLDEDVLIIEVDPTLPARAPSGR